MPNRRSFESLFLVPGELPWNKDFTHPLTDLPDRRLFDDALEYSTQHMPGQFGVIQFDVDGLKQINDTVGHEYGDALLKYTAQILPHSLRSTDLVSHTAHIGGDEFASIVVGVSDETQLLVVKKRVQDKLTSEGISMSAGGAIHTVGQHASELLRRTDAYMYADKIERKLRNLTPEQKEGFRKIGAIAAELDLNLRDAVTLVPALRNLK